jgi:lantibiotic modifying enzyme
MPTPQSLSDEQTRTPEAMQLPELQSEIRETLAGVVSYIQRTATPERMDRLWPASAEVFATNPLSLAHGAAGIALFLHRRNAIDSVTLDWLQSHPLSTVTYPPGFWIGLAGIAYSFWELGLETKAHEALALCYESPLAYADPSVFNGNAGWGLVSLYLFEQTRRDEYLARALEAAEWHVKTAVRGEQGWSWPTPADEEKLQLGFGFGASGIALFLLMAGRVTRDQRFIDGARAAFEFDFAHRIETPWGWSWPARIGDEIVLPYWGSGGAGIGGVALRLHEALGDARYLEIATTVADDTFAKWTIQPGLVSGLTGIGEFMLDCYRFTRRPQYLERAYDIARTLLLYRVPRPEGVAYPDRWMRRLSNDITGGSAGIGLFFDRLLLPGRNPFMDLTTEPER